MTLTEIEAFKSIAPLLIPTVFDINFLESIDDYDDYAMLTFTLAKPMHIDELIDNLDDQMELNIMYQVIVRNAGIESQQCCAYSNPTFEHMYKVNAQSDGKGMVDSVYVYIFSSLEFMLESLKEDLELHSRMGESITKMSLPVLIADFM